MGQEEALVMIEEVLAGLRRRLGIAKEVNSTSDSNPSRALDFDIVVLGGGPAGASGAAAAALFGQRVALVEQAREVGGAGVMTGTLPSKTLRETAVALSGLRARKLFGIDLSIRHKAT